MENRHEQPPPNDKSDSRSYDNVILDINCPDDHKHTECSPMVSVNDEIIVISQPSQLASTKNYEVSSIASTENEDRSTSSSDAEDEDAAVEELTNKGWLTESPSQLSHQMNGVALPCIEPPNFGDVKVENSTNVHLGNRTFYKGPVTIKQVVYAANSTSVIDNKNDGVVSIGEKENGVVRNGTTNLNGSSNLLYEASREDNSRVLKLMWRYRYAIIVAAIAVIIALIVLVAVLLSGIGDSPKRIVPANPNDTSINNGVSFVSRKDWRADIPTSPREPLDALPPPYVIVIHTVTQFCSSRLECSENVRNIQSYHMSLNFGDIGYNFLISGDGEVYVGRGWDVQGAHTHGYNKNSLGIAFIGNFMNTEPTKSQLDAAKKLLELGVKENKLTKDFKLLGHCQVMSVQSPGEKLFNIIKTWEHWTDRP